MTKEFSMLEKIDSFFGVFVKYLEATLFYDIQGFPIIIIVLLIGSFTFTIYFKFINLTTICQVYTLLRLGGRQPLCAIGVTSLIDVTIKPMADRALKADSRPEPGPCISTSIVFTPCS